MLGNKLKETKGQERPDMLPMWSGKDKPAGAAIVGQFSGSDQYTAADKDELGNVVAGTQRPVRYIKLINVIEFTPLSDNSADGTSAQHLALGVPLNADTRNKLDPDTLPLACFLLITFTGTDARFNNMRRYSVQIISRAAYNDILAAEAAS